MKCLMMERGLHGFIKGTVVKPEVLTEGEGVSAADATKSREKLHEYELKADKAYSLIALCVEKDLQVHVASVDTAKEAWDNLQNHF